MAFKRKLLDFSHQNEGLLLNSAASFVIYSGDAHPHPNGNTRARRIKPRCPTEYIRKNLLSRGQADDPQIIVQALGKHLLGFVIIPAYMINHRRLFGCALKKNHGIEAGWCIRIVPEQELF